jgi:hydroxyacylglutathione hydrolase
VGAGLPGVEVKVLDGTPEPFQRMISPYLIVAGDEGILVDSGPKTSADILLSQVESEGVRLRYIILTHIHLDHGGGAGTLYRLAGSVMRVYVHPRGVKHLVDPDRLWAASRELLGPYADYYGRPDPLPESVVAPLGDGETIELLGVKLRVLHTPGHASHHVSVYLESEDLLFTGDSAGVSVVDEDGVTRIEVPTNPPPFKPALYYSSLERMIELAPAQVALGHFGFHPEGVDYLVRHRREIIDWFKAVVQSMASGSTEPLQVALALSELLDMASKAYNAKSRIISEFFYMGAVLGLADACLRGEEFPSPFAL